MSLFTQRITEMIFESGETVQTLAETGKINRSTLQRVKSGERLPSQPVFQGLCKALRLSAAEGEELKILLEMETMGPRNYHNRKAIVGLIETISELTEHTIPFSKEIDLKKFVQTGLFEKLYITNSEYKLLKNIKIKKWLFLNKK